jgi:antirestriction protein ArdC
VRIVLSTIRLYGAAHMLNMTTTTPPARKRTTARKMDRPGQAKGNGTGGSFASADLADAKIEPLSSETVDTETTVWNTRYESPEAKVQAFMLELETQVAELATDKNWQNYLNTMSKFYRYSARNQLLIALQCPGATHVAGYKKWAELGRQVRKGERGIAILAPKTFRVDVMDTAGNPVLNAKGKPEKTTRTFGMTTASVFDISQTDGPDLPSDRQTLTEEPPAGLINDLETAIADQGFTLSYEPINEGKLLGYTTTDGSKRIVVKTGLNAGSTARVLAHELGHVKAGHLEQMDEYHEGHSGGRGRMEVEADSISYALLRANGMSDDVGRANAAYVSGWGKRDPETVKAAATTVAKAVQELFKESTWVNAG